ncbi:MAG TPA: hypothetical protein VK611_29690 [Acidimicrobiales bacterium]|nr:hypothetical protein [Acidimicrobiales bacterium]
MTADRPAAQFWARAEEERRALLAAFAAEARGRMSDAGGIDSEELPRQGRRILAWLAETDDPTVDGVVDLLAAARRAGRREGPGVGL